MRFPLRSPASSSSSSSLQCFCSIDIGGLEHTKLQRARGDAKSLHFQTTCTTTTTTTKCPSLQADKQLTACQPGESQVSSALHSPNDDSFQKSELWPFLQITTPNKKTHTPKAHQLFPPPPAPPSLPSCSLLDAVMLDVCYLQISILQLLRPWSWSHRVASILHDFYVWLLLTRGKLWTQSAISSLYLLPWFFLKTLGSSSGLRIEFARDRTVRSPRSVKKKHPHRRPESKSIIRSQIWRCDRPRSKTLNNAPCRFMRRNRWPVSSSIPTCKWCN